MNALHPRFATIFVIIVYRSLLTAHFDEFFTEIEDLLSATDRCALIGDFHYNLQDNGRDAADFIQKLTSLGFYLPRFHLTYMDHHGHSVLDMLASFGPTELQHVTASSALVKGHVPPNVNFQEEVLPGSFPVTQPPMRRDWSAYTPSAGLLTLQDLDWTRWYDAQTTSALANIMCEHTMSASKLCASLVPVSKRNYKFRAEPWRTSQLENLERAAAAASKRYSRSRHPDQLAVFRALRAESVTWYSCLLSKHIRSTVLTCSSQTDVWRKLKSCGD